jgi:hypothetical protein
MSEKIDVLTPYVNTDAKIPRKLREALTLFETSCCMRGVKTVTASDVQKFLTDSFGSNLASTFSSAYLLKSPNA